MLKRTVVRLLMFGIPFSLSYIATRPARPAPPAPAAQTFVICVYGDHGRELVIAPEKAGCAKALPRASESANRPGVIAPAFEKAPPRQRAIKPTNDVLF
jgi:hypothetical protein